jgi:hypothetical protein
MYQKVLKIQPCMFENKLQVFKFFLKTYQTCNKFGMLKIYSLNKKKTLKALNLHICVKWAHSCFGYIIFSQILNV